MAKKKEQQEETLVPSEVPDTGLLNKATATQSVSDIVIDEVDFNDLLDLEKAARTTEEQLNKLSGAIYRYSKEQDLFYAHEKKLNTEIDNKRKDLVKRYRLDEQKQWKIDINSRKVVYS